MIRRLFTRARSPSSDRWRGFLIPLDDERWGWWHYVLLPVSIPLFLAWGVIGFFVLIAFVLYLCIRSIPEIPAAMQQAAAREQDEDHFVNSIRAAGRYMPWSELEPKLIAGEGTLIVEQWIDDPKALRSRFWWTTVDVAGIAPVDPPPPDDLDLLGRCAPHAFVIWCFEHVLHPESGKAKLTEPDARVWKMLRNCDLGDHFRHLFPFLRVVEIAAHRHLCTRCGYDLRASKDRCPECGTPIPATTLHGAGRDQP